MRSTIRRQCRIRGTGRCTPATACDAHGGPTSSTNRSFKWAIQFWTSAGFAVVDVNYSAAAATGGISQQLNGRWGVDDVDDAVAARTTL